MSTKPTVLPRWANVGGAIVQPSSAKLDIGWVAGERPPAQYDNWHKNLTYLWLQYLSDAAFSGATTFDSTVGVAGLLTASGNVTTPTLTATTGLSTPSITGAVNFTGAVTMGTTLGVSGAATLTGGIANTVTLTNGATAAVDKHVTVSGAGLFKHGIKTINVPTVTTGLATNSPPTTVTFNNGFAAIITGVPVGARIQTIRAKLQDIASNVCSLKLASKVMSGTTAPTSWTLSAGQNSLGNGAAQLVTLSGLAFTVTAFTELAVQLQQVSAGAMLLWEIELDYDQP